MMHARPCIDGIDAAMAAKVAQNKKSGDRDNIILLCSSSCMPGADFFCAADPGNCLQRHVQKGFAGFCTACG
jgi:hypothetical protein